MSSLSPDDSYYNRREQGERRVRWRELARANPRHYGYKYYPCATDYWPIEWRKDSMQRFVRYVRSQHTDFQHISVRHLLSKKYRINRVYWARRTNRYSYRQGGAHRRTAKRLVSHRRRRANRRWQSDAGLLPPGKAADPRPPHRARSDLSLYSRAVEYQKMEAEVSRAPTDEPTSAVEELPPNYRELARRRRYKYSAVPIAAHD